MATKPNAQEVQPITLAPVKFFVRKKTVRPMLHALTGTQPNQFQPGGAPGLQDRTDLSGKFSRRLGAIRRALSAADASIIEDRKDLTLRHAEKFPALDKDGNAHPKAGQPTPVYALDGMGNPVFKKDAAGNDTDERIVSPDQYNVADPIAFEREFKAMLEEFIVVECVGFTEDDFNAFKVTPGQNSPIGKIIDPLIDLERGGETEATPEEQADGARREGEDADGGSRTHSRPGDRIAAGAGPEERTRSRGRRRRSDRAMNERRRNSRRSGSRSRRVRRAYRAILQVRPSAGRPSESVQAVYDVGRDDRLSSAQPRKNGRPSEIAGSEGRGGSRGVSETLIPGRRP
jgi:hypothetical protein